MSLAQMPLARYLVPDEQPALPDGFTLVDERITDNLPHAIQLDNATTALVVVPTGLAVTWRDADPAAVVTTSDSELAPLSGPPSAPIGELSRVPARLIVRRSRSTIASVPLAIDDRRRVHDSGDEAAGVPIEIVILSWEIHAGNLRGAGDFGSRIRFGWRRADQAIETFGPLPVNPYVRIRLPLTQRLESEVAVGVASPPAPFRVRRGFEERFLR